jgi:hypothetical protein
MELCVMIEGQEGVTWPQWLAIAHACEEHGAASLFRSDHYLPLDGHHEREVLDAWGFAFGPTRGRMEVFGEQLELIGRELD